MCRYILLPEWIYLSVSLSSKVQVCYLDNFPAQRSRVSAIWEMLRRRWIRRISRSRSFHINEQKLSKSHVFTCSIQEDLTCQQKWSGSGRTCKSYEGSGQEKVKRATRWWYWVQQYLQALKIRYLKLQSNNRDTSIYPKSKGVPKSVRKCWKQRWRTIELK